MNLSELLYKSGQDNKAAQQLYDLFAEEMFMLCRQYAQDDMTANEMMINGFLRFFRRPGNFRYVNAVTTNNLLRKIMTNECLRYLKKNKDIFLVSMEELPEQEIPEEIIAGITAKEIYMMISKLPRGYRTVFSLAVLEDKTHKEIAEALNITERSSQSQLRRAKKMLQQLLIQKNKDYEYRKTKPNKEKTK